MNIELEIGTLKPGAWGDARSSHYSGVAIVTPLAFSSAFGNEKEPTEARTEIQSARGKMAINESSLPKQELMPKLRGNRVANSNQRTIILISLQCAGDAGS